MGTTPQHEALRELFSDYAPELAPLMAEALGLAVSTISPLATEQTQPTVEQLLPDVVLAIPGHEAPEHIIVVEVQLRIDERKWRKWPQYIATAHARYRCAADVLVVAPHSAVAAWARRGRTYGRGMALHPCVLGKVALATLDGDEVRRDPVRAVAATIANLHAPNTARHALETFEALAQWDGDPRGRLSDMLEAALPQHLLQEIEDLMRTDNFEYKSDFARKYYAKGREEGREEGAVSGQARTLLLVLETRELPVDTESRARILSERDPAQLDAWTRRAVTAATVAELFED